MAGPGEADDHVLPHATQADHPELHGAAPFPIVEVSIEVAEVPVSRAGDPGY